MQDASNTRQRALDAALELFAHKGYEGTSMGDIAGALGIKAPSLYKYFSGKEELYQALSPMIDDHYRALWADAAARQEQLEHDVRLLGVLNAERLEQETLAWLNAELADSQALSCRRFLALGQFADDRACDRWLWEEPLALYEGFFDRLIQREVLRRGDPHVMAVEYLAPILQLLALRDRRVELEDQYVEEIRRHIRQFHRVFAHKDPQGGARGMGRLFRR